MWLLSGFGVLLDWSTFFWSVRMICSFSNSLNAWFLFYWTLRMILVFLHLRIIPFFTLWMIFLFTFWMIFLFTLWMISLFTLRMIPPFFSLIDPYFSWVFKWSLLPIFFITLRRIPVLICFVSRMRRVCPYQKLRHSCIYLSTWYLVIRQQSSHLLCF